MVKMLATQPDDSSSVSRIHRREGENQLYQNVSSGVQVLEKVMKPRFCRTAWAVAGTSCDI